MLNRAGTFMMGRYLVPAVPSPLLSSDGSLDWNFDHSPLTFLSLSAPVNIWTLQIVMLRPTLPHQYRHTTTWCITLSLRRNRNISPSLLASLPLPRVVCNIWEVELNISLIQVDPRTTVRANLERTKLAVTGLMICSQWAGPSHNRWKYRGARQDVSTGWSPHNLTTKQYILHKIKINWFGFDSFQL